MKKIAGSRKILVLTVIIILWGVTLFFIEGCARIPLSHLPGSVSKISGSVSISNFKYVPAESGKVKSYQIRNTSIGSLKFDKNIDTFFRDAVFAELHSTGIKLDDKNLVLGGEIKDFLIDELSASVDWTLIVNYSVNNLQTGDTLYKSTKITKRKVSKLVNISSAVAEMIKLNIEELLQDKEFIKAIN
jgi:hypothetical protein